MRVLGIETSCDDTSVALVRDGGIVESVVISSQVKAHRPYGGVVPELAARMHTEAIHYLLPKCLEKAGATWSDIDRIAVTTTPGLEGALLIGVVVAKTLGMMLKCPVVPVNHIWGHIYSVFMDTEVPPEFPFVALVVSGGHTQLWSVTGHYQFELLGQTRDDAVGEAFDKVARQLGLDYPGGPPVEKRAALGNPKRYPLPRPLRDSPFEFSFSGLKTAVMQLINGLGTLDEQQITDICASFQAAVIDSLIEKSAAALRHSGASTLCIVGGVAANRTLLNEASARLNGVRVVAPPIHYCTDNAAMIATAAHYFPITNQTTLSEIRVGMVNM